MNLKKIFGIFSKNESEDIKKEDVYLQQFEGFMNKKDYDSSLNVLRAYPNILVQNNHMQILANLFIKEIEKGNFDNKYLPFLQRGEIKLGGDDFVALCQNSISDELKKVFIKQYLKKHSTLNITTDYLANSDVGEEYTNYIIKNLNSENYQKDILKWFKKYLKEGGVNKNEDLIFYLASPLISKTYPFDEIKNSTVISPKIVRAVFSHLRNNSMDEMKSKIEQTAKKEEPITIESLPLSELPLNMFEMVKKMIERAKKYEKVKVMYDGEDKYFLSRFLPDYLPETLHKYLTIDKNFRDKVLENQESSATQILLETLLIYEKRLDMVNKNIVDETTRKFKLSGLFIDKLGSNLVHYQNGTSDQIGEIELPDVPMEPIRFKI
jgi:hypothetical protein